MQNRWNGLEFWNIKKRTTKENVKGIYQMFFRNPIPLEAVVFDDYEIHIVPHEFYKICEKNGMNKGMIYEPIILV